MTSPSDGNASRKPSFLRQIAHPYTYKYDISVTEPDTSALSFSTFNQRNRTRDPNVPQEYEVDLSDIPCTLTVNRKRISLGIASRSSGCHSKEPQIRDGTVVAKLALNLDFDPAVYDVKVTDPSIEAHIKSITFEECFDRKPNLQSDWPVTLHESGPIALQGSVTLEVHDADDNWRSCHVKDCTLKLQTHLGRWGWKA